MLRCLCRARLGKLRQLRLGLGKLCSQLRLLLGLLRLALLCGLCSTYAAARGCSGAGDRSWGAPTTLRGSCKRDCAARGCGPVHRRLLRDLQLLHRPRCVMRSHGLRREGAVGGRQWGMCCSCGGCTRGRPHRFQLLPVAAYGLKRLLGGLGLSLCSLEAVLEIAHTRTQLLQCLLVIRPVAGDAVVSFLTPRFTLPSRLLQVLLCRLELLLQPHTAYMRLPQCSHSMHARSARRAPQGQHACRKRPLRTVAFVVSKLLERSCCSRSAFWLRRWPSWFVSLAFSSSRCSLDARRLSYCRVVSTLCLHACARPRGAHALPAEGRHMHVHQCSGALSARACADERNGRHKAMRRKRM
jgi:hypothetical protein